jgi:uncharacterized protein
MKALQKALHIICLIAFIILYFPTGFALSVETTSLVGDATKLTVATFNVENLDPKKETVSKVEDNSARNIDDDLADGKFTLLGNQIVTNLQAPDIIALQEIQDNDGAELSSVVDATLTANALIAAITEVGGPRYLYRDISPKRDQDGGQPGGNIRVGFLFNPDRVKLQRLERFSDNTAFNDSRKPLVGEFTFNNNTLVLINNHFASKSGGPSSERQRVRQAVLVNQFVTDRLAADPRANIIVLGDLNDTPDSATLSTLTGNVLENLDTKIPATDRYSYIFRGDRELIDQILVTANLADNGQPEVDAIHINAGMSNSASDHDPVVARFTIFPSSRVTIPPVSTTETGSIFPDSTVGQLLKQLDQKFSPLSSLGYGNARELLYTIVDNENGIVTDIYGGYKVEIDPDSSNSRNEAMQMGINAEHVWPQSLGATGAAKSDLHNLFAAREEINQDRSNFPFADIPDDQTTSWYLDDDELSVKPNSSAIDQYSELKKGTVFEPRENKKGDIARAMFYFRTVYPELADNNFFQKQKQTLCQWQALDPVDEQEIARSHKIARTPQGNENPFILDPTLAARAYCN